MSEPRPRGRAPCLYPTLTALAALALCVSLGEALVRASGRGPLAYRSVAGPVYYRPDERLGWVHVPGHFEVAGAPATFLADGSRATATSPNPSQRVVLLVGGSFTEGFGVSDEETFAWLLQQRFPDLGVENFGTGGWGTLQALMLLEERLPQLAAAGRAVELVAYGFMWHHPVRNVAHVAWRRQLTEESRGQPDQGVRIPYALLDGEGGLRRLAPAAWPVLPLETHSALVHFLTLQGLHFLTRDRVNQAGPVTWRLLAEMDRLVRDQGGRLLVAFLYAPPAQRRFFETRLEAGGVAHVNCSPEHYGDPRLRDPETEHPTALTQRYYADCIGDALREARSTARRP